MFRIIIETDKKNVLVFIVEAYIKSETHIEFNDNKGQFKLYSLSWLKAVEEIGK